MTLGEASNSRTTGRGADSDATQEQALYNKAETGPMKNILLLSALAFALIAAVPARAQAGCDDTPENPTLILAGLASGAYAVSSVRTRILARRAPKK